MGLWQRLMLWILPRVRNPDEPNKRFWLRVILFSILIIPVIVVAVPYIVLHFIGYSLKVSGESIISFGEWLFETLIWKKQ